MALGENQSSTYLSITNGKIARRVKEKTAKSVSRTTASGKEVHEELYDFIEGHLIDIKTKDIPEEYGGGKTWLLQINDGENEYQLQFPYSSGYANGFLMSIQNCDLTKPIKFFPWAKEVDGKKKTALYLNQQNNMGGWEAAEWVYTKDKPNGCPPMVQTKYKGKDVWDDTDRMEFLSEMINAKILPALRNNLGIMEDKPENKSDTEIAKEKQANKVTSPAVEDVDDLPF